MSTDWFYEDENLENLHKDSMKYMANDIRNGFHSFKIKDEKPPFYSFNTFALRENNCAFCRAKVYGIGWYFRFLHLQTYSFSCEKCHASAWEYFLNSKPLGQRGIKFYGVLVEKLGNEIIKMLQAKALTN